MLVLNDFVKRNVQTETAKNTTYLSNQIVIKSETINMVLNGSNMTCLNPDHFLARLNVTGHKYQDITTKDELFLIFDVVMDSDIK